jgi:hypothetical protein
MTLIHRLLDRPTAAYVRLLTGVAHPGRDAVDGKQERPFEVGVVLAVAATLEKLHLEVVKGGEVVVADLQRGPQQRLAFEEVGVTGQPQEPFDRESVLAADVVQEVAGTSARHRGRPNRRCRGRSGPGHRAGQRRRGRSAGPAGSATATT